jgi:transcription antitermination factor NusG
LSKPVSNPRRTGSSWFVLRIVPVMTTSVHEGRNSVTWQPRVATRLSRLGCGVYVPMRSTERQHRRSKKWTTFVKPLVASYVFVSLPHDRDVNWLSLLDCPDVIDVLRDDDQPFPVLSQLVEQMMAMQQSLAWDDTREAKIRRNEIGRNQRETAELVFQPGRDVRITDGPFAGHMGTVSGVTSRGTVETLIRFLGQLTPCEVEAGQLERLAA